MSEELYLQTDDRLKVGDKPVECADPKIQKMHDYVKKHRKQISEQFRKH